MFCLLRVGRCMFGLREKSGRYVGMTCRNCLRAFDFGWRPVQQSSLGTIRKSLIDGQIAGEHDAHVVRPVEHLLRLKPSVEVTDKLCVAALG